MAVGLHSISLYSLLCLQGSEKGAVYCVPSSAALEMLAYQEFPLSQNVEMVREPRKGVYSLTKITGYIDKECHVCLVSKGGGCFQKHFAVRSKVKIKETEKEQLKVPQQSSKAGTTNEGGH